MANYQYDEGGGMATYFLLTFMSLILFPVTFSLLRPGNKISQVDGCQCTPCIEQRERIRDRDKRSLLNPKLGKKVIIAIVGWILFFYLAYKVVTTKVESTVYDPFEILGLRHGVTEKEIKSHYKKLSRKFHPDKVKLIANQTMESVAEYFVDLTKAYKSLTDETVRKNWELYGHPDGRQEVSTGIAIPKWIVEGKNKHWVLLAYCLVIGGFLPFVVGRWWFGTRMRTKDGVLAKTAEMFFKNMKENSSIDDVFRCFSNVLGWEVALHKVEPIDELEEQVRMRLKTRYDGPPALTLLYAYLFRLSVTDPKLRKEQERILLQAPTILTSLLNISMSHSWLQPTLNTMRLHAYLAQALPPSSTPSPALGLAQMPGFKPDEVEEIVGTLEEKDVANFLKELERRGDERRKEVEEAAKRWGRLDVVDISFKVIGERIVTPSAIVHLVVKLRISSPLNENSASSSSGEKSLQLNSKADEEKDNEFLISKRDSEESVNVNVSRAAHAPYWPWIRKPSWWLLLADEKSSRVVVPPMRITDVPFSDPSKGRNYRSYKLQFQAPQTVGIYTWNVFLISDTFVGEEVVQDVVMQIEDVSSLHPDEQIAEDEISDPEEDSIAGQMAAMRGGTTRKSNADDDDDDDDDDSSTDDDKGDNDASSSDSD